MIYDIILDIDEIILAIVQGYIIHYYDIIILDNI